ncbi:MAG: putative Ig domain-containing protein, partial [Verrucomicrobiae bacterium]|nr:putative Ig domain-containing protein [Verrucomicrobiae bacterium]
MKTLMMHPSVFRKSLKGLRATIGVWILFWGGLSHAQIPNATWGTYFGGSGADNISAGAKPVAVGPDGGVYIAGITSSSYPTAPNPIATSGVHQSINGGGQDAFLAKFSSSGNLIWSTYYGGSSGDGGTVHYGPSVVISPLDGSVYLCGNTSSLYNTAPNPIATPGTFHSTSNSTGGSGFVAKFNPSNGTRVWGTYLQSMQERCDIAVGPDGSVYVVGTGYAWSASPLPIPNEIGTTGTHKATSSSSDFAEGFLIKLNPINGTRIWGTFYGGSSSDHITSVSVANDGSVYVGGYTFGSYSGLPNGIATPGSHQGSYGGGSDDLFVVKFNPTNGTRIWGTYYGGSSKDIYNVYGPTVHTAVDPMSNEVYILSPSQSVYTYAPNPIASVGTHQSTALSTHVNTILAKFNATTGQRVWGTYYGGTGGDMGFALAVGPDGSVYLGGMAGSFYMSAPNPIATTGTYKPTYNHPASGFLAKLNPSNGQRIWGTYVEAPVQGIAISSNHSIYIVGSNNLAFITPDAHKTTVEGTDAYLTQFSEVSANLSAVPSCPLVGQTINATIPTQALPGCAPVTFTAHQGVPPGLTFTPSSGSATLSGAISTTGTYIFKVTVQDSCGRTGTYTKKIMVGSIPTSLPNYPPQYGMVGQPFSFNASGTSDPNYTPVTYSMSPGIPGLTINSSTGIISGTPTTAGITTTTVTLTTPCNSASKPLTIQIVPNQPCSVINLNVTGTPQNCGIQLNWGNDSGCTTSHHLAIQYRVVGSSTWTSVPVSMRPAVSAGSYTIGSLSPTNYEVQVQVVSPQNGAVNAAGWVTVGGGAITVTNCAPPTITGPTSVTHCNPGAVSITMTATNSPTSWAVVGSLPTGLSLNA